MLDSDFLFAAFVSEIVYSPPESLELDTGLTVLGETAEGDDTRASVSFRSSESAAPQNDESDTLELCIQSVRVPDSDLFSKSDPRVQAMHPRKGILLDASTTNHNYHRGPTSVSSSTRSYRLIASCGKCTRRLSI